MATEEGHILSKDEMGKFNHGTEHFHQQSTNFLICPDTMYQVNPISQRPNNYSNLSVAGTRICYKTTKLRRKITRKITSPLKYHSK